MQKGLNKMTHNFLFEIGLEEMPARAILDLQEQLAANVESFLNDKDISFTAINRFSTPRRLAVIVEGLPEKQEDSSETVKGPAKKIALDEEGNWTKAAIGFSKGQGKDVDDIVFKELNGEEYVFIEKFTEGLSIDKALADITDTAKALNFPVSMKWGKNTFRYIRPIHTLITLLDDQVIDTELLGVTSSNKSLGHRFLGEEVTIDSVANYESLLEDQYVIPDRSKRQALIKDQIINLCEKNGWQSPLYNQDLLDEVTDLVEYPTVFFGEFDQQFLDVPERILETSMADHQRYFPVRSLNDQFLPYFIGVRNGDHHRIENVIKGNEKVLIARLEDAKFFYEDDKEVEIKDFVIRLENVTYHEKLGSMLGKQERVQTILTTLKDELDLEKEANADAVEAAKIYKFDLMTKVVDEFSSLQGYIGEVYAREIGLKEAVAKAIGEQYYPTTSGGELPSSEAGAQLAMADKLESLLMFFSIGLVPTGSNDPFALRRTAYGLVRIIEDRGYDVDLTALFKSLADALEIEDREFITDLELFIRDRLNQYMKDSFNTPHDIRQATIGSNELNVAKAIKRALVLADYKDQADYKLVGESLSRVANLAAKQPTTDDVDPELAQTQSEKDLILGTSLMYQIFDETTDAEEQYVALRDLSPLIDAFFEDNMVNAKEDELKTNRYALLNKINRQAKSFADFNQLITK